MKRFLAILFALVLLISAAGCGNSRFSAAIDEDEFYESLSYVKMLENEKSVVDTEVVYLSDGSQTEDIWHIDNTYNANLGYSDGSAFYFIGKASFVEFDGELYAALNFGWPFEDYREVFLDSGFYAPDEDYTLKKERAGTGYTVTATFIAGDSAEIYTEWDISKDTEMRYVYELDGKDRLISFKQYAEDRLLLERTFEYGDKVEFPKSVTEAIQAKTNVITLVMPGEEYDISESFYVPDGMKIYCSTGYTFFTDRECTKEFDYTGTPITDNMELYAAYK